MKLEVGKEYTLRNGKKLKVIEVHEFNSHSFDNGGARCYAYARLIPRGTPTPYWADGPLAGKLYSNLRLRNGVLKADMVDNPEDVVFYVQAPEWEQQGLFE